MWSAAVLEELEYHETAKLIKRGEASDEAARRALRLVTQMRAAFADAEVRGWQGLEGTDGLPNPDDEHVVAAAVVAGAGAIITHNLRHFPPDILPASAPSHRLSSRPALSRSTRCGRGLPSRRSGQVRAVEGHR